MKKINKDIIIFIGLFIFAGDLSLFLGMDRTWDVLNYHIYNPYAFLNNRILTDIMPAGIQSYFNPLLDLPYYLCINYLNDYPAIVTFLFGFSYALLLFMIYKISDFIFQNNEKRYFYSIISVIIASGLHETVKLVGWLSHDILVGDLVLISVYLLLKSLGNKENKQYIIFSGFIIGCAAGLKLTAMIFVVPLIITFIIFNKNFYNPLKSFLIFIGGILGGFLLFDGFWMYKMYKFSGNPFFPYFDWLFHSDMINVQNIYSVDFGKWKPTGFVNAVFHVFTANITQYTRVSKILWLLFFINLFLEPFFIKNEKFDKFFNVKSIHLTFLWVFIFFSYIAWLYTFTVIRYFIPILCLIGIIVFFTSLKIFYLLLSLVAKIKNKEIGATVLEENLYSLFVAICFVLIFFPHYKLEKPKKLIRVPAAENILVVEDLQIPDNSVVIVEHGTAIFIPSQNPNAKYIGLNSYHFRKVWQTLLSEKKTNEIKSQIKQNPENIYLFARTTPKEFRNVDIEKAAKTVEKHKGEKLIFRDESRQNELRVWEAMAYDLDLLGVNVKATKCHKIKHNIFDYKYAHMYKHPVFSFCKLELKNN